MNLRHSSIRDRLAERLAKELGLKTAKAVAGDAAACEKRDELWMEYERLLRDTQTYTLADILAWLKAHGVEVTNSPIHRDRWAVMEAEETIRVTSAKARSIMDAAKAAGPDGTLAANLQLAQSLIFRVLMCAPEDLAEGATLPQVRGILDVLGRLAQATAQADLVKARLEEIQAKVDAAKKAADKAAGEVLAAKGVDLATINRIREVYGLAKLSEIAA